MRYQDRLYTLALRVTLSEPDARDCVQEGLISAWRAIDRFRGDARFSTWIYRIVLRKAYDVLDRRARTAEPIEEVPAVASTPADDRLDLLGALASSIPSSAPSRSRATSSACRWTRRPRARAAGRHRQVAPAPGRARLAEELEARRAVTDDRHDEIARRLREEGGRPRARPPAGGRDAAGARRAAAAPDPAAAQVVECWGGWPRPHARGAVVFGVMQVGSGRRIGAAAGAAPRQSAVSGARVDRAVRLRVSALRRRRQPR